ncbi:MAG TPA: helix-turn-helix domain-containing protein [Ktedonobacteraceae bacterium]
MAKARQVVLTPAQERELIWARDHHQKAYLRTKAAAILKVAAGQAMRQVAAYGLLKPVKQEVVSQWIDRYESEGLPGLVVRKGRGRKPAFSPCGCTH